MWGATRSWKRSLGRHDCSWTMAVRAWRQVAWPLWHSRLGLEAGGQATLTSTVGLKAGVRATLMSTVGPGGRWQGHSDIHGWACTQVAGSLWYPRLGPPQGAQKGRSWWVPGWAGVFLVWGWGRTEQSYRHISGSRGRTEVGWPVTQHTGRHNSYQVPGWMGWW